MTYQPGQKIITSGDDIDNANLVGLDTGGAVVVSATVAALAQKILADNLSSLPPSKLSTQAATATITVGGLTGALSPAVTLTGAVAPVTAYFPPATELAAAAIAAGIAVGESYQVQIANLLTTTGVMTLGASAGITLSGLATLTGQNSYGRFNVTITSANAVTITRVG